MKGGESCNQGCINFFHLVLLLFKKCLSNPRYVYELGTQILKLLTINHKEIYFMILGYPYNSTIYERWKLIWILNKTAAFIFHKELSLGWVLGKSGCGASSTFSRIDWYLDFVSSVLRSPLRTPICSIKWQKYI